MMHSDYHPQNRLPHETAEPLTTDRRRQIDSLVSGDLKEPERVELLAWLDADRSRWRYCGLAFLESQVWREVFAGSEVGTPAVPSETTVALPEMPSPQTDSTRRVRRVWRPVLSAAVVILVFGCGWLSAQLTNQRPDAAVKSVAQDAQSDRATGQSENHGPALNPATKLAARVVLEERPRNCEFTLPMLGAGLPAEHWARHTSVPGYIKSQWGHQGYQVSEKRQFVPMELADGRRVVVPINHVTLTYVGQHLL